MARLSVSMLLPALLVCACSGRSALAGDGEAGSDARDMPEVPDAVDRTEDVDREEAAGNCVIEIAVINDLGPLTCTISALSSQSCVDFLRCLCTLLMGDGNPSSILWCMASELTPRGSISMADFCTEFPPPRFTLAEAVPAYLREYGVEEEHIVMSPECSGLVALTGPVPYEACLLLEQRLCPCIPGVCDADLLLQARCLDLTRDEVTCVVTAATADPDRICENLERLDEITADCLRD
jgi:hypothetical protein